MANKNPGLKARGPGWFSRLFKRSAEGGSADWLRSFMLAFQQSKSGQRVDIDTALRVTAVLACTRVIAEDTAALPFVVQRRDKRGAPWVVDDEHWLARLMRAPNEWQTQFEFVQMLTAHAALCGDGYAFINRPIGARATELLPLPPGSICPEWIPGDRWGFQYRLTWREGQHEIIPRKSILRLRGFVWDSIETRETFRLAREAIGISLATEESHAKLHKNGVRLSGILTTGPQAATLSNEAATRIAKQWKEEFGPGANNEFGVAVLEGGMKFEPMSMTGVDAQHLETRAFQVVEICRAMRVYPQMIGHYDKGNTFSSSEQMFLAHDSHTIAPWGLRWSQRVERDLLAESSEPHTWPSFDGRGLRRGDAKTRSGYYNSGIHAGWLSRNEARRMEGLEEKDGLDEFLSPVQLAPGDSADATNEKNSQVSEGEGKDE